MRKRFTALTVALATLPMAAITATSSPAVAAPGAICGAYPAGQIVSLVARSFPRPTPTIRNGQSAEPSAKVRPGATISLVARVTRGGEACYPKTVAFYLKARDSSDYVFSGSVTTNTAGDAIINKAVNNGDFRWEARFANRTSDRGLVQVVSR